MISGDITSDQIFKSYRHNICYQGGESRLFGTPSYHFQGVSTTASEQDQDIIVDLREVHVITAIATQGTYDLDDHSISTFPNYYTFQFRENSSAEWKTYLDIDGSTKVCLKHGLNINSWHTARIIYLLYTIEQRALFLSPYTIFDSFHL